MMGKVIFAAAVLALAIGPAFADSQTGKRPQFSPQERTIIERNADLKGVVGRNPRLVRRVLDAIAAAPAQPVGTGPTDRGAISPEPPAPSRNPDLDNLERSSPEAAHDLFLLLKKASQNRKTEQR
jgi:hypothetical protein